MSLSVEKFFEDLWKKKSPDYLRVSGEDPFLERELRQAYKAMGFEVLREDIKTASPSSAIEDLGLSASLFQPKRVLWIQAKGGPDKWSKEGTRIWDRVVSNANADSMVLILQVGATSAARKGKAKEKSSGEDLLSLDQPNLTYWLNVMNERRNSPLDKARLAYLLALDFELVGLDNAVELWALGGDTWAKDTLGWGQPAQAGFNLQSGSNPSFAGVDAVLEGRENDAVILGRSLMNNGGEFLMLLGLLAKSLKIWGMIEEGRQDSSQPPFLISKIQKIRKLWTQKEGSSGPALQRISKWTADSDLWIKSRPVVDENLLLRISESARLR